MRQLTMRKLLAVVLAFAGAVLPGTTALATNYAVCVGVNQYDTSYIPRSNWLNGAVPDANHVQELITSRGAWEVDNVTKLTNSAAKHSAIRAAIASAAASAVPGDTFLYFHSSHGGNYNYTFVTNTALYTDYPIMVYGVDPDGVDNCICAHDADYTAAELAADLSVFDPGVKVVVMIDACHSAGMFMYDTTPVSARAVRRAAAGKTMRSADPALFASAVTARLGAIRRARGLRSASNVGFITAANFDEYSWDGSNGGRFTSAFAKGVTNGLCDGADYGDQDGYATFYEGWNYAKDIAVGLAVGTAIDGGVVDANGYALYDNSDYAEEWGEPEYYYDYNFTHAQIDNETLLRSVRVGYAGDTEPTPADAAPEWAEIPTQVAVVGQEYRIDLAGYADGQPSPAFALLSGEGDLSGTTLSFTPGAAGTYPFTVAASNSAGMAVATFTVEAADREPTKYALCVGINKYTLSGCSTLNGCVNDSAYFYTNLVERGGWQTANMTKLNDSKATKADIRAAISNFSSKAKSGDIFIYQHSSHGDSGLLCTYDANYTKSDLAADLRSFESGVKVVMIVDACYSGSLFKDRAARKAYLENWDFAGEVSREMDAQQAAAATRGEKGAARALKSSEIGWVTAASDSETSVDFGYYDTDEWLTDPDYEDGEVVSGTFMGSATWGWWHGTADTSPAGDGDGHCDPYEFWKIGCDFCTNLNAFWGLSDYSYTPQCTNVTVLRAVELGWVGEEAPGGIRFAPIPVQTVTVGQSLDYTLVASNADGSTGTITYSVASSTAPSGSWSLDGADFTFTPPAAGSFTFGFLATNTTAKTFGKARMWVDATLAAPTGLAASGITSTSFTAVWDAVPGATSYELDVVQGAVSGTTAGALEGNHLEGYPKNVGNVTSHDVTGLQPSTEYTFAVRAIAGGEASGWSGPVSVTTAESPAAPAWSTIPPQQSYVGSTFRLDLSDYLSGNPTPAVTADIGTVTGLSYMYEPDATGTVTVTLTAVNDSGTLATSFSLAVDEPPVGGNHYAVIVGCNKYDSDYIDPSSSLNGCVPDANHVHDLIVARGQWQAANVTKLTDSSAKHDAILSAISAAAAKAVPGDIFLYFHSSHGGNYTYTFVTNTALYPDWPIMVYSVDPEGVDNCICSYDADFTAAELASALAAFDPAVNIVVMIDACHSAGMFQYDGTPVSQRAVRRNAAGKALRAADPGLFAEAVRDRIGAIRRARGIRSASNVAFVTAANFDEYSYDSQYGDGGEFTTAFIDGVTNGLCDGADYGDQDGWATFYEGWNYAKDIATGMPEGTEVDYDGHAVDANGYALFDNSYYAEYYDEPEYYYDYYFTHAQIDNEALLRTVRVGYAGNPTLAAPVAAEAADVTDSSFTASWTAVDGATGYRLQVATDPSFSTGAASDTLAAGDLAAAGSTYTAFSGVAKDSGAVYAGKTARHSSGAIQFKSGTSTGAGIWTTASGGSATRVAVEWNSTSVSGRSIQVYGSDTALTSYSAVAAATLLGTIACGTDTELDIDGTYAYVGILAVGSVVYLDSVTVDWRVGDGASSIVFDQAVGNTTSHEVTGLEAETGYWYRVQALGRPVDSDFSNVIALTTKSEAPERPANDDYADAEDLGKTVAGSVAGDNEGATWEAGEPAIHSGACRTNSVWWMWTAPATGVARFDTVGADFDTVLAVFTNASPADIATLKAVKSDGGSAGNGASRVWFNTAAKRQYWIAVAGSGAQDSGTIALNWQQCVKVAFKGNGATSGSMGTRTNVFKKATALPACKFKRTGWECDGWATSATGTVAYALDAKPAFTKNTTLYAHWKLTEQRVTFDANGGTCGTEEQTYAVGEPYGELPEAKRTGGQVFLGWWTEKEGGEQVTEDCVVEATALLTLWAHWTDRQVTTFLGNGGKPAVQATTNKIYADYGTLPEAKWSGHAFLGWFNAPESGKRVYTNSTVTLAATRTLYAQWTDQQVTTFKANGGYPATQKTTNTIYEAYGAFPEVKWSGHALVGWFNAPEGGKRIYTNSTATLASTRTLYAQWTTNQVTTFKGNGGTPEIQKTTNAIYTHYGTLPEAAWENHVFLGWFNHPTKGKRVYTNTTVTLSATRSLYAHWTDKQVTTFKGNGGTPKTQATTNTMGTAYGPLPTPKKSGYALLGWFTAADGGDEVTAEDMVTTATSRTLYAHWTDQQVTTFLGNGGTPEIQTTTNTIYGKYDTMPTAMWDGHVFQGWFNAAEGGKRVYTNSTVTLNATRTLYAHWTTAKGFSITAIAVGADGGNEGAVPRALRGTEQAEKVCRLRFELSEGTEYEIQWTASLNGEWETVERLTAETDGEVEVEIEVPGGEQGFFRLVVSGAAGDPD